MDQSTKYHGIFILCTSNAVLGRNITEKAAEDHYWKKKFFSLDLTRVDTFRYPTFVYNIWHTKLYQIYQLCAFSDRNFCAANLLLVRLKIFLVWMRIEGNKIQSKKYCFLNLSIDRCVKVQSTRCVWTNAEFILCEIKSLSAITTARCLLSNSFVLLLKTNSTSAQCAVNILVKISRNVFGKWQFENISL